MKCALACASLVGLSWAGATGPKGVSSYEDYPSYVQGGLAEGEQYSAPYGHFVAGTASGYVEPALQRGSGDVAAAKPVELAESQAGKRRGAHAGEAGTERGDDRGSAATKGGEGAAEAEDAGTPAHQAPRPAWEQYIHEYADEWVPHPRAANQSKAAAAIDQYADGYVPHVKNTSDSNEWRKAFMHKYADAYKHYADDVERLHQEFKDALEKAGDAHTVGELKEWRGAQRAQIESFVPKTFQRMAEESLEAEYRRNKARIAQEQAATTSPAANASKVTTEATPEPDEAPTAAERDEAPAKREPDDEAPARRERDDEVPAKRERDDEAPARRERDDEVPAKRERDDEAPARRERDDEAPARRERDDEAPARRERDDEVPAKGERDEVVETDDAPAKDDSERPTREARAAGHTHTLHLAAEGAFMAPVANEPRPAELVAGLLSMGGLFAVVGMWAQRHRQHLRAEEDEGVLYYAQP